MKTNSKLLFILIIAVIILAVFIFFVPYHAPTLSPISSTSTPRAVATTTPVSNPNIPDSWKSYTDPQNGVSFRYPANLSTTYINTTDWPPQPQLLNNPVACTVAGTSTDRSGGTQVVSINNHTYCVTEESGGAAGSTYNQYAYGRKIGSQEVILTFTLQYPECLNYNGSKQTSCQNEENSLNVGEVIDKIFSTLSF